MGLLMSTRVTVVIDHGPRALAISGQSGMPGGRRTRLSFHKDVARCFNSRHPCVATPNLFSGCSLCISGVQNMFTLCRHDYKYI